MITLRPYQQELVTEIRDALHRTKRILAVMPTGAGKSRTACHIIESAVSRGRLCLVLVNRDRLVKQWHDVMSELGLKHGIIQFGIEPNDEPVQIASVDSYVSRLDKKFDICISDEAHYVLGDNYRACIEHQDGISIGLTATPMKMNGDGFGCLFDEIVQGVSMRNLQDHGYLSNLDIYSPAPPDVDIELIDGDFNQAQYMRKVSGTKRLSNAIELYRKHIDGKRTIIFAVNIADSRNISKAFTGSGIHAKCIHSKQSQKTQDAILKQFCNDEFKVLVSVNILSEGADFPWLEAGIDMAPTASLARYIQKWGRLLRISPGKTHATMLDLAGSYWIHGEPWIDHEWSLEGRKPTKKGLQEAILSVRVCLNCGRSYNAQRDSCQYCNEPVKRSKRAIKQADGTLMLVTCDEYDMIELEKKERIKAEEIRLQTYKDRKRAAKTLHDYELIEHDLHLKPGWAYVNYKIYKKYVNKYK